MSDGFKLIRAKRIIDGIATFSIIDGAIVVKNDRISFVGKACDIPHEMKSGAILELGQDTVMPGMINSHGHLHVIPSLDATGQHNEQQHRDSMVLKTIRSVANLRKEVETGVTTLRVLGEHEYLDLECKRGVEEGIIPGPRLLCAGLGIRATHGHGFMGTSFTGVEEVRRAVRENIAKGVDVIKIFITGGIFDADFRVESYFYSEEEIRAVVEEAHRVGCAVAAHAMGGPGLIQALKNGVDTIEHAYYLTDEAIELFLKTGAYLIATYAREWDPKTVPRDAKSQKKHMEWVEGLHRTFSKAVKSGVRFGVGTDGRLGIMAKAAEILVELGLTPLESIWAVTKYSAEACRVIDNVGTLEVGKFADIISIEGDPTEDIKSLRKVNMVMKGGIIVKNSA